MSRVVWELLAWRGEDELQINWWWVCGVCDCLRWVTCLYLYRIHVSRQFYISSLFFLFLPVLFNLFFPHVDRMAARGKLCSWLVLQLKFRELIKITPTQNNAERIYISSWGGGVSLFFFLSRQDSSIVWLALMCEFVFQLRLSSTGNRLQWHRRNDHADSVMFLTRLCGLTAKK